MTFNVINVLINVLYCTVYLVKLYCSYGFCTSKFRNVN